jgi:hypothetical protein
MLRTEKVHEHAFSDGSTESTCGQSLQNKYALKIARLHINSLGMDGADIGPQQKTIFTQNGWPLLSGGILKRA